MSTSYTSLLGLALPATGELSGTWGDTVNNGITSLLDSAISGTTTITLDQDVTLTTTTGSANTAREAILLWTAGGSATRTITAPAQSKIYTVINASSGTQSIILAGAGPTTGVTIAKGESALCAWNGSDFIKISNTAGPGTFTNLTVTGNTTLGDADTNTITQTASYVTGTQLKSAKTATNTLSLAAYDVDGTAYTNLITLTASNTPTLALTSTGVGTINNMSIGATTASTGAFSTLSASSTVTLSGGTINGVAYLNGSNVLTTGSALSFDGTVLTLGTSSGLPITGSKFSIGNDANSALRLAITNQNAGASSLVGIDFQPAGGGWKIDVPSDTSGFAPPMYFKAGASTNVTFAYNGNVGVGATSPVAKLDVQAATGTLRLASSTGTNAAYLYATNTGGDFYIGRDNSTGSTFGSGTGYASVLWSAGAYPMTFFTNGTERARIDSSGNLGIGTSSPSSFTTGGTPILVVGNNAQTQITLYGGSSTGDINFATSNSGAGLYKGVVRYDGTSNFMSFWTNSAEKMRLDASGNLGIGTTSPSTYGKFVTYSSGGYFSVNTDGQLISAQLLDVATAGGRLSGYSSRGLLGRIRIEQTTTGADGGYISFETCASGSTSPTEQARINASGNLLVGTTTVRYSGVVSVDYNSGVSGGMGINDTASGNGSTYIAFLSGGTFRGNITNVGNTAVAYNTTSDYRLKENIVPMTGALAKVAQLKPVTYKWISNGSDGQGFIAHELAEVVPDCVAGKKDDVDKDGNPRYQGVDTSFLVATLTAAIQEQQALITQLTARITALEGA